MFSMSRIAPSALQGADHRWRRATAASLLSCLLLCPGPIAEGHQPAVFLSGTQGSGIRPIRSVELLGATQSCPTHSGAYRMIFRDGREQRGCYDLRKADDYSEVLFRPKPGNWAPAAATVSGDGQT